MAYAGHVDRDVPGGGLLQVFAPEDAEQDPGPMFVLDVLGVQVLVRERPDGTVYVHVDRGETSEPSEGFTPSGVVAVEVFNGGENHYGDGDSR